MNRTRNTFMAVMALLLAPIAANAAVIVTVTESGGDVVFSSSGTLDLSGAVEFGTVFYGLGIISGGSNWYYAQGSGGVVVVGYVLTGFDGPFGTSVNYFDSPTSSTGDNFAIWGGGPGGGSTPQLLVGSSFVSGSAISGGLVFASQTFASMGLTAGSYLYTLPNDSVTLNIGVAVPEPATLALLGLGLVGMGYARRRKAA